MKTWQSLPQKDNQIKLFTPNKSLATLYDENIDLNSSLIKTISEENLNKMKRKVAPYNIPAYIIIKVYKTKKDYEKNTNPIFMAFSNHGQVHFCHHDILENFLLDNPLFYFNYQIKDMKNLPPEYEYAESYCFSKDKDALKNWTAQYNYETIFDHFGFNGFDEMAAFAGFYLIK